MGKSFGEIRWENDTYIIGGGGGPILLRHAIMVGSTTMDFSSGSKQWEQWFGG